MATKRLENSQKAKRPSKIFFVSFRDFLWQLGWSRNQLSHVMNASDWAIVNWGKAVGSGPRCSISVPACRIEFDQKTLFLFLVTWRIP
jgi:hypothetical protein